MLGHIPVLVNEVTAALMQAGAGKFMDCTFGGGGHSRALLMANAENTLFGLDTDPFAGERAKVFAEEFGSRFGFYDLNFGNLHKVKETNFKGILFDLGVSSYQLDQGERGFSFRNDAPADMRLDPRKGVSAYEFLEKAPQEAIVEAVRDYGEEDQWKRVVRAILEARGTGVLARTGSLAELISNSVHGARKMKIHPATKTFQGIRIAVNGEMDALEAALPIAYDKLMIGGLLGVISFHSLEDRIVKRFFKMLAGMPEHKADNRYAEERNCVAEIITRRPIEATDEEISRNPRSRSAKFRVIRKEKTR